MARQVLENGVILPAEYSDDWYDDMTSNLTKLDDVIGSDSEKLSSADVGAAALSNSYNDLDNLPTIPTKTSDLTNDSNFVDTSNSAVASGITSAKVTSYDAHIADTDIHVTTADKATWNTVTSKANDSDVVHTSGNETVDGVKTFSNGAQIYNANSSNNTPSIFLRTSKVSRGSTTDGSDNISLMFNDNGNSLLSSVRCTKLSNGTTQLRNIVVTTNTSDNIITCEAQLNIAKNGDKSFIPSEDNNVSLGKSGNKWKDVNTYLVNGLTPSSLSMPDLSNSIDISSYITDLAGSPNVYTSPANGYIVLRSTTANVLGIVENTSGMGSYSRGTNQTLAVNMPVVKGSSITVYAVCSSLTHARFIPCQGNV